MPNDSAADRDRTVAALIAILHERRAPHISNAISRLADLGASEAIPAILDLARDASDTDVLDVAFTAIQENVPRFGAAAIQPVLDRITEASPEFEELLADVLVRLGIEDDRIFDALARLLDHNPWTGATMLERYGDARAMPLMRVAIERFQPSFAGRLSHSAIFDLLNTYKLFGGVIDTRVAAKLLEIADVFRDAALHVAPMGDPDGPCWEERLLAHPTVARESLELAERALREIVDRDSVAPTLH